MIKKSIITAISLFTIYTVFTLWFAPKWWNAGQNQWHSNLSKAQNFMYDDTSCIEKVIVGSSLSCRIVNDSLPSITNFAFSGQSIFDGLNIISKKSVTPKVIFVEMNVVLRPEMPDFTSTLNSPILFYPRKTLPSLRFDKQPLAILGKQLNYYVMSKIFYRPHAIQPVKKQTEKMSSEITNNLFSSMLDLQIKKYSIPPTEQLITEAFIRLKEYTDLLEKKGSKFVFFEMPVNDNLNYLPQAISVREAFYRYYPKSKYQYIPLPKFMQCKTTDGAHLTHSEAITYTNYFKTKLNNLAL